MAGDALHMESSALETHDDPRLPEHFLQGTVLAGQDLAYRAFDADVMARADVVVVLGEWGNSRSVALPNGAGRIDWHLPLTQGTDMLEGLHLTREVLRSKVADLVADLGIRAREEALRIFPASAGVAGQALQIPAASLTASAI